MDNEQKYATNVKYPNRFGGLIDFASSMEEYEEKGGLLPKGESMKNILQQIKENIVRIAFCWGVCFRF